MEFCKSDDFFYFKHYQSYFEQMILVAELNYKILSFMGRGSPEHGPAKFGWATINWIVTELASQWTRIPTRSYLCHGPPVVLSKLCGLRSAESSRGISCQLVGHYIIYAEVDGTDSSNALPLYWRRIIASTFQSLYATAQQQQQQ